MAVKFAATMNAVNKGLNELPLAKACDTIKHGETALADVDVPGAKGIARNLATLRKQLEKSDPSGERVLSLINWLGQATTKIADRSDKQSDKLTARG